MTDIASSLAQINERIASIQARFGVRPPISTGAASVSSSTTAGSASAFGDLVDRMMTPNGTSSSPSDLLASILEQQSAPVSVRNAAVTSVDDGEGTPTLNGTAIVDAAKQYLGTPYVWGGEDPTGFDCSGLVQYVYGRSGVALPRVAKDQATVGEAVPSLDQAVPGDLIAFGDPVDHIGIYAGDGKMVVAPHTGDVVKVQDITRTPTAIRRIITAQGTLAGNLAPAAAAPVAAATPAAASDPAAPYREMFRSAAAKYGVSADLLEAVAKQESRFDPNAVSSAGAQGLMQLMPSTAAALGVDAFDPAQAIDGSARLLSQNLRRFGTVPLALAAYNAGPGSVERYGGVPPYRETRNYVDKIMADLADSPAAASLGSTGDLSADLGSSSFQGMFGRAHTPLSGASDTSGATLADRFARRLNTAAVTTAATSPAGATAPAATTAAAVQPVLARSLATTTGTPAATATAATTAAAGTTGTGTAGATTSVTGVATQPTTTSTVFTTAPLVNRPTGPITATVAGAWGPSTQTQVTSVGGDNTVSWAAGGLLAPGSSAEISALAPTATGPVAKGVLKILRDATPAQLRSPEFRQTLNDVNRDALGDPNAPDVIPVQPPTAGAPASTGAPAPAPAKPVTAPAPAATTTVVAPPPTIIPVLVTPTTTPTVGTTAPTTTTPAPATTTPTPASTSRTPAPATSA